MPRLVVIPTKGGDLSPAMAFELDVRVDGRLIPGSPITITASAKASQDVQNAVFRIVAPEMESARQSGWGDDFRVPVKAKVRVAAEVNASLVSGSGQQFAATVQAERPGYYRVVVSAVSPTPTLARRTSVQDATHREVWLLIDDAGGRVLENFDPTLVPAGTIPQPGPWRKRSLVRAVGGAKPEQGSSFSKQQATLMTNDGYDHYHAVFFDNDSGNYLDLPGVSVEYTTYRDDGFGGTIVTGTEYSGSFSDGSIAIDCSSMTNQWYDGFLRFTNGYVVLSNIGPFFGVSGAGDGQCGTYATVESPRQIIAPSAPARVFTTLTNAIPLSRSFFGKSRGQIAVNVYDATGTSNYTSGDIINIYSNAIWTSFGRFAASHEYGHALHAMALGGNAASGYCPEPHNFDQLSNLRCAFSEGFADFHSRAVGATYFPLDYADYTLGCTSYTAGTCTARTTTRDGSVVEGAVAGFLFHLTNPTDGLHDNVEYPGSYVADLIKTCTLTLPASYYSAIDGADYMIYCLESDMSAGSFPTRSFGATDIFSNPATKPGSWSASAIRQLWRWDLYRQ